MSKLLDDVLGRLEASPQPTDLHIILRDAEAQLTLLEDRLTRNNADVTTVRAYVNEFYEKLDGTNETVQTTVEKLKQLTETGQLDEIQEQINGFHSLFQRVANYLDTLTSNAELERDVLTKLKAAL